MCPWCGDEADDTPEQMPFKNDICETECGGCGKPIIVERRVSIEYACYKKENQVIYLSGPMSGTKDHNFPAFEEAARTLRAQGHTVISPHELEAVDHDNPKPWEYYVRQDLILMLTHCSRLALLPGWQSSQGARLEVQVASSLRFVLYDYVDGALRLR
jgi:hypothetical protein